MIQRERKSGWYERFTEYVESAVRSRQASRVRVNSTRKYNFCVNKEVSG